MVKRDWRKPDAMRWIKKLLTLIEAKRDVSLSEACKFLKMKKANVSFAMRKRGYEPEYRYNGGKLNAYWTRETIARDRKRDTKISDRDVCSEDW